MLTIITNQEDLKRLSSEFDWYHALIRETHGAHIEDSTLIRILINLYSSRKVIELVGFEMESFEISSCLYTGESISGTIQRRLTELDFGSFSISCGCLGYQVIEIDCKENTPYYSKQNIYSATQDLLPPYNIDWKPLLDEATKDRTK